MDYLLFTIRNSSPGYCAGFCLKWLGDILNKNKPGYSKGAFFVDVSDKAQLIKLMERAKKKQDGYEMNRLVFGCKVGRPESHVEFLSKYNDYKQRELEKKTGQGGLYYKYSEILNNYVSGLTRYPVASQVKEGVILVIRFVKDGVVLQHAIAAVRVSEEKCFFFDPNKGMYEINDRNPEFEIKCLISREYEGCRLVSQIVVSQSRSWST